MFLGGLSYKLGCRLIEFLFLFFFTTLSNVLSVLLCYLLFLFLVLMCGLLPSVLLCMCVFFLYRVLLCSGIIAVSDEAISGYRLFMMLWLAGYFLGPRLK